MMTEGTEPMDATTRPKPLVLDSADDVHARAIARLQSERIAWFTTIRANGFPHAVPLWFLWLDDEVLILSEPGTVKARNVRGNPHVLVHLEAGPDGEQLTVLQGLAAISEEPTSAWLDRIGSAYGEKYAAGLASLNLTAETMAEQFTTVIRVVPSNVSPSCSNHSSRRVILPSR